MFHKLLPPIRALLTKKSNNNHLVRVFSQKHAHLIGTELAIQLDSRESHLSKIVTFMFFLCKSWWRTLRKWLFSSTWSTWSILDLEVLAVPLAVWILVSKIFTSAINKKMFRRHLNHLSKIVTDVLLVQVPMKNSPKVIVFINVINLTYSRSRCSFGSFICLDFSLQVIFTSATSKKLFRQHQKILNLHTCTLRLFITGLGS